MVIPNITMESTLGTLGMGVGSAIVERRFPRIIISFRFSQVEFQVVIVSPRGNIIQFQWYGVGHACWNKQIGVISILEHAIVVV